MAEKLPLKADTTNGIIRDFETGDFVGAAIGGTGLTSYTAGDIIYATGATTLVKLAIGSSGTVLTSTGSAPSWAAFNADTVDGYHAVDLLFPLDLRHYYPATLIFAADDTSTGPGPSTTSYFGQVGSSTLTAEAGNEWLISTDGYLAGFIFEVTGTNGITATSSLNVRVNGSTVLTITIPSGDGGPIYNFSDLVPVAKGDRVSFQLVTGASGTTISRPRLTCCHMIRATHPERTRFCEQFASVSTYNAGGTYYFGGPGTGTGIASSDRFCIHQTSKARRILIYAAGNTCTLPISFRILLQGVVALTFDLPAGATTAELDLGDHGLEVTNENNILVGMVVPSSPGGTLSQPLVVIDFEYDRTGLASIPIGLRFSNIGTVADGADSNTGPGYGGGSTSTEAIRRGFLPLAGILANFAYLARANATTGDSTVHVRLNNANSALTVTVPAGSTAFVHDTTHTVSVVRGDYVEVRTQNGGGGAITNNMASLHLLIPNTLDGIEFPTSIEAGGRLSASSTLPVPTSDITGAATLYYLPYRNDRITLFNGFGLKTYALPVAGLSLALSGLTSGKPYDVFIHDGNGTLTLSLGTVWTNDTTRAEALGTYAGCPFPVKLDDARKRWLGTIYTTGTGTFEDSEEKRYLCNAFNPLPRPLKKQVAAQWTLTSTTWIRWNSADTYRVNFLAHPDYPIWIHALITVVTSESQTAMMGLDVDGTTANDADQSSYFGFSLASGAIWGPLVATLDRYMAEGRHYVQGMNRIDTSTAQMGATQEAGYDHTNGIFGWCWC